MERTQRIGSGTSFGELRLEDLEARARRVQGERGLPLRDWVALAEAWRIAQALRDSRGNRSAAARALGIGRRTLYTKMEKLGLEPVWTRPAPRVGTAIALTEDSTATRPPRAGPRRDG